MHQTGTTSYTVTIGADGTASVGSETGDNFANAPTPVAKIVLTPNSTNAVNNSHTFTATVMEDDGLPATMNGVSIGDGVTGFTPLPPAPRSPSASRTTPPGATITSTNPTVTIAGGTATVTVLDALNTTGHVDVHAVGSVTVDGAVLTPATGDGLNGDGSNATKTWVDLEIKLDANSVNPVNQSHTFTATVEEDLGNGAGFVPVPTGTPVTFSLSGNTAGATITSTNPTTTTGDTATVTVLDASYKTGIVTVNASTTLAVAGVSPAITRSTGDSDPNDGANATKTWVDLDIVLSPLTSTNPVNVSHTFTATVEEDLGLGAGFVPVPSGTPVNFTLSNNTAGAVITAATGSGVVGSPATTATAVTIGDIATVTVLDGLNTTGSVTINASTTLAVGTALPAITRSTGDADPHDSANAVKTWVTGSLSWIKDDGNGASTRRRDLRGHRDQRLRTGHCYRGSSADHRC